MSRTIATDELAETQVVGGLLLAPELIDRVSAIVRPEDFFDPLHAACYSVLLDLDAAGEPIDVATVRQRLEATKQTEKAASYLAKVGLATVTAAHAEYHAKRVRRAAQTRKLAALLHDAQQALDDGEKGSTTLCRLMARLDGLARDIDAAELAAEEQHLTATQVVDSFLAELERGQGECVATGIESLDYALSGGLCRGEMTILAGRPSHGKTMVALQLLDYWSASGHACLLLSEEMSRNMLAKRLLNRITPIGADRWHACVDELREDAARWVGQRAPLYLAEPCGTIERAIQTIDAAARRGIRVIAVDYAQLLRGSGNSKYETTSDVSQRLREATSRHDLLLLCLCQLSRKSEEHEGAPRVSDIRDSGQFEQDADVILFVDWPSLRGDKQASGQDYYLRVRKNRNRETLVQDIKLRVDRRRQTVLQADLEWNP